MPTMEDRRIARRNLRRHSAPTLACIQSRATSPAAADAESKQQQLLRRAAGSAAAAEKWAECVICFEPLCEARVAVLRRAGPGGRRACSHFFHQECAEACPREKGCPLCRAEYGEVVPVPPLYSAEEWFKAIDVDGSGLLEEREVLQAVVATVPVDPEVLEAVVPALWSSLGRAPGEALGFEELAGPAGFLGQLQDAFQDLSRAPSPSPAAGQAELPCPDLGIDKTAWFDHWDTDGSGVLEREEVVRGLVKGFRRDGACRMKDGRKVLRVRRIVQEMWPLVDLDGNGSITMWEFCQPGGLADLVLHRFQAKWSPRGSARPSPRSISARPSPRGSSRRGSKSVPASSESPTKRTTPTGRMPIDLSRTDVPDDCGGDDLPGIVSRPSMGFDKSPSHAGDSPTGADGRPGLPREPWSVLGRRRSKEKCVQLFYAAPTGCPLLQEEELPGEGHQQEAFSRSACRSFLEKAPTPPRHAASLRSSSGRRRLKSKESAARGHGDGAGGAGFGLLKAEWWSSPFDTAPM